MQLRGITGHIEWFPQTVAQRHNFHKVYVQHSLKGNHIRNTCNGHPEIKAKMGGTFNYCCRSGETTDAENWFEGWRQSGKCAGPLLLHPLKADVCNRFATNGFGRGCWKRRIESGALVDEFLHESKTDLKDLKPFAESQL